MSTVVPISLMRSSSWMISQRDERIEVAGGFVGDDEARVVDHGAGDGRALHLAAGELVRPLPRLFGEADQRQRASDRRRHEPRRGARHLEGEGHVLIDRLARQQAEVLEDDADLATQAGHLAAAHAAKVLAGDLDAPGRRLLVTHEQLDERGLAGTRWPHEEDEVARRERPGRRR